MEVRVVEAPSPYLASKAAQEAATDRGLGLRPVRTQESSAARSWRTRSRSARCAQLFPGEGLDEVPVPAGAAERGAIGRLVLHEGRRVVDGVQGEDGERDPAEVRSLSQDRSRRAVGSAEKRSTPALSALSSCEPVQRTPRLLQGFRPPSRWVTMSWKVKVANRRCDSRVRSGMPVSGEDVVEVALLERGPVGRVRGVARALLEAGAQPAVVIVEPGRRPCHNGYRGSVGRGWLWQ